MRSVSVATPQLQNMKSIAYNRGEKKTFIYISHVFNKKMGNSQLKSFKFGRENSEIFMLKGINIQYLNEHC